MNFKIRIIGDELHCSFPYSTAMVEQIKTIPNRTWSKKNKAWKFPLSPSISIELFELCAREDMEIVADEEFYQLAKEGIKCDKLIPLVEPEIVKHKLWRHQLEAYNFILHHKSAMLYMGMGTGKTKVIVDFIINNDVGNVLIVCPTSVIDVWRTEFEKHAGNSQWLMFNSRKDSVKKRSQKAVEMFKLAGAMHKKGIAVFNYESVWRDDFVNTVVKKVKLNYIVADESHRIKTHKAKATEALYQYGKDAERRVCLTGTPMSNMPLDIFGQYKFLDENLFGRYWTPFKNKYAIYKSMGQYDIIRGVKNTDELNEKFYRLAYRADRDVLDLPDAVHQMRYTELKSETLKAYKSMLNFYAVEYKEHILTATNALVKMLRLQQIASGYMKDDDTNELIHLGDEKIKCFKDSLLDIPMDEPISVFCRFTKDIEQVKKALVESGRSCAELSGHENTLKEWQDGKYHSIVVQVKSGGLGITLVRSRYCIYYSLGFSLGDYEQSLARAHRPGQKKKVVFMHIVVKGTIDETIYKTLEKKGNMIEEILSLVGG